MENKKTLLFVIIAALVLLGGGILLASRGAKGAYDKPTANAKAVTNETAFDWGEIGINDGKVGKIYNIKNEGTESLILQNVATSCMCTSAQLIYKDQESPIFSMHQTSSYKLEIPANETAQLKVIFDPAFHGPSGVGPINRQVTVETNDQNSPELTFMLTAMVRK